MTDQLHLVDRGAHRTAFRHAPLACQEVLLVGEDNPQSSDPRHALFPYPAGCAGNRLQERILGLSTAHYLALWRTNLCSPRWRAAEARIRAEDLLVGPWRVIVMLGRKVGDAFGHVMGVPVAPWGTYLPPGSDKILLSLPHPSGRNLAWNDPRAAGTARKLIDGLVPGLVTA